MVKERLSRAFTFRKSKPVPALRPMKAPFTVGRAAVPWMVLEPVVMLNGSAE